MSTTLPMQLRAARIALGASVPALILSMAPNAVAAPQFGTRSILNPTAIAADVYLEDVDRDGVVDIVTPNFFRRRLDWLQGLGAGTFAATRPFITDVSGLTQPAFGDIDGDGDRDLVFANNANELRLVTAGPNGLVGLPLDIGVQGTNVRDVRLGDVDGDGDLDVLLLEVSGSLADRVSISLNMGAGIFSNPTPAIQLTPGYFFQLAVGDIDGDGLDDLAYKSQASLIGGAYSLSVALADGQGAFQTPTLVQNLASGTSGLILADLTGDGRLDLATRESSPARAVLVQPGIGGGQFGPAISLGIPVLQGNDLDALDMDLDGAVDLVVTTPNIQGLPTIQYFPAQAGGTFGSLLPASSAPISHRLTFGDVNGDGWSDAVGQLKFTDAALGWMPHQGSFAAPFLGVPRQLSDYFGGARVAAVGDFDGDGMNDVISNYRTAIDSGIVAISHPVAGAYEIRSYPSLLPNSGASLLEMADLDADGLEDLILTTSNGAILASRSLGAPGFDAAVVLGDAQPLVLARTEDVDGDGDLDVLAVRGNGVDLVWYANLGAFAFAAPQTLFTGTSAISTVRMADLDGDGLRDLVLTQIGVGGAGGAFWLRRTGGSTYGAPTLVSTTTGEASGLVIGDFNGDGVVDLGWAAQTVNQLLIANGLGGGAFGAPWLVSTATNRNTQLESGDVDLDGDLDLVLRDLMGAVKLLRSDGAGTFVPESIVTGSATTLELVDLDQDGDIDLLTADVTKQWIYFFENSAADLVGTSVCGPAISNSTGLGAEAFAFGSDFVSAGELTLRATEMPTGATAFFLCSQTVNITFPVNGSSGRLCLGGGIGRLISPGQIQSSGPTGSISVPVDLQRLPTPNGLVAASAGQAWSFQAWFRDALPSGATTSNFTDAISVTFQ